MESINVFPRFGLRSPPAVGHFGDGWVGEEGFVIQIGTNIASVINIIATYLIFVIFLHEQNFWRIRFTPKKRVNYDKIHSKLPIFCVITAKYTVNFQFFALNQ